jgi:hypothetical protein
MLLGKPYTHLDLHHTESLENIRSTYIRGTVYIQFDYILVLFGLHKRGGKITEGV